MSRPLESDELKALKGQEIWLIPLDNAAKRRVPLNEQITSGILEKCGTKMFYLSTGGYSFENYCNPHNFGYMPFKTKQDALNYLEVKDFVSKIKYEDLSFLGIDEVRKIKEIIESCSQ